MQQGNHGKYSTDWRRIYAAMNPLTILCAATGFAAVYYRVTMPFFSARLLLVVLLLLGGIRMPSLALNVALNGFVVRLILLRLLLQLLW